jgi:DNA gyrase/topoisomerase IV subunit A
LAGSDVPSLRLLWAASLGATHDAVVRRLTELNHEAFVTERPSVRRFPQSSTLPHLTDSDELPDWRDGLTRSQRQVVEAMRSVAPHGGSMVPVASIAKAAGLEVVRVARALAELGNARLRPLPLVEVDGLTVEGVVAARLGGWVEEFLAGELALPLLLINGAAGRDAALPPGNPGEVLDAAIRVTRSVGEGHASRDSVVPDFPTGGVLDRGSLDGLGHGVGVVVRLLARVKAGYREGTDRCRLVIDELPWPLTIPEVEHRLRSLVTDESLEGALAVSQEGEALSVEFSHLVWARRAASELQLVSHGVLAGPLQVTFPVQLVVEGPSGSLRMSPREYLGTFIAHQRDQGRPQIEVAHDSKVNELSNAEALVVALTLRDAVQTALRSTVDPSEERQALMHFMTPELRGRIDHLGTLTHPYFLGFTEAQAVWLTSAKRLTARSLALAEQDFRRLRDEVGLLAHTRWNSSNGKVRLALETAKERFAAARRTRVEPLRKAFS